MSSDMPMPMPMPMPGPNPMDDNNGTTTSWHPMAMPMSFYWGTDVVILFNDWPGFRPTGNPYHRVMYGLALVLVFFLAAGAEILSMAPRLKPRALSPPIVGALVHALVFGIRMCLAYFVMLSVMTFNSGVFVVAIVGHVVGAFVVKYRALTEFDRESDMQP